ncbi:MAG TPA: hypothetical protein VK066_13920 [Chloroflexota bacterium]|nr:hypothetical protein [Chloroflexota bacterium]
MNLTVRAETRTERLARLLAAWRYDRSQLTPDDIEWLLERAQEAMEAGVGICKQCARDLDDPGLKLCWYCVRDASFLEGGDELRPLD